MKVYVDELPRSCGDCEFFKETEYCYYCDKLHMKLGYINKEKDCPLHSLADYTKQVRKEVCEEIRKSIRDIEFLGIEDYVQDNIKKSVIHEIDQIQEDR